MKGLTVGRLGCLIAALAVCCACDKQTEKEYVYVAQDMQWKETLQGLDWGTGTAYVVGHKTPDADAVCSAVAYAALMRSLGFRCEARRAGVTNRETDYLRKRLGIHIPPVIDMLTASDRLIMVDHSEYVQAVDGADRAKLLQIIDHHALGNAISGERIFMRNAPVGSSCTMVYSTYRDFGVAIPDSIATSLFAGILSDTENGTKNYTKADSIAITALADQLRITDFEDIYKGMVEAACSYDGMTDEEIYQSDAKEYVVDDAYFGIGSLDWYESTTLDAFLDRIVAAMRKIRQDKGMEMIFCKVSLHSDPPYTPPTVVRKESVTYIAYDGEGAREIIEGAYGPSIEGKAWVNTGRNVNRKSELVPVITEAIKKRSENQ
ncbi:MAG: DHH family phosphoesterase [Bacteroidaceae bacterium]|nr:DHH family phosphoesterase [Bacteroidaceae bacterium]